jgi:hypothetical protein
MTQSSPGCISDTCRTVSCLPVRAGISSAMTDEIASRFEEFNVDSRWDESAFELAQIGQKYAPDSLLVAVAGTGAVHGAPFTYFSDVVGQDVPPQVEALALIALVEAAGQCVHTFADQQNGAVAHCITPKPEDLDRQSSTGAVRFYWHSDDPMLWPMYRVEQIHLLCVTNECSCATYYLPLEELMSHLSNNEIEVLSQPMFHLPWPDSFCGAQKEYTEARPILSFEEGEWRIACEVADVNWGEDDQLAESAVGALGRAVLESTTFKVVLRPGEYLSLSNFRGLHSRDEILGHRLLWRVYSKRDLSALRQASGVPISSCKFNARTLLGHDVKLALTA